MPSRLPRRSNTALYPALIVALVCATALACAIYGLGLPAFVLQKVLQGISR